MKWWAYWRWSEMVLAFLTRKVDWRSECERLAKLKRGQDKIISECRSEEILSPKVASIWPWDSEYVFKLVRAKTGCVDEQTSRSNIEKKKWMFCARFGHQKPISTFSASSSSCPTAWLLIFVRDTGLVFFGEKNYEHVQHVISRIVSESAGTC